MQDDFALQSTGGLPAKGSLKSLLNRLDRDAPDRSKPDNDPTLGLREARRRIAALSKPDQKAALSELPMAQHEQAENEGKHKEAMPKASGPDVLVSTSIADALSHAIAAAPDPDRSYPSPQHTVSGLPDVVDMGLEDDAEDREASRKTGIRAIAAIGVFVVLGAIVFAIYEAPTKDMASLVAGMSGVLSNNTSLKDVPQPIAAAKTDNGAQEVTRLASTDLPQQDTGKPAAVVHDLPQDTGGAAVATPAVAEQEAARPVIAETQTPDGVSAVVQARPGERIALPLNLDPVHVSADVSAILVRGLPSDYSISGATGAGEGRWALLAETIQDARLEIPATGAGRVKMAVDMFNSEAQRIAQTMIIIDVSAQTAQRRLSDEQMNELLVQGKALFASGDVAAARLLFERAAEGGHGPSAFAMAETFEIERLKTMAVQGIAGDPARARHWYQRAHALGNTQAGERLAQLPEN